MTKRLFLARRGKVSEDKRKWNLPPEGETALIHQTREILTSKPTFIQGVSEKLLKTGNTNCLLTTHYMVFRLNWKLTMLYSPFFRNFLDTLYFSLINPIHGQNVEHNHNLNYSHNAVKTSNKQARGNFSDFL